MPVLSGVSGNALAYALSLAFGLGVWNQPLARGPATVDVSAQGDTLTLIRAADTCFGKTTACATRTLLLDVTDAELTGAADGKHLVAEGGVVRLVAGDDTEHFSGGVHVGGADVHCASADALFDMIDPQVSVWSGIMQVQTSGSGGLDGLAARMELTGRTQGDASAAEVACAAFDDEGAVTYALLDLHNLDRLGDNPRAVTGTVYNSHLEIDLDWAANY